MKINKHKAFSVELNQRHPKLVIELAQRGSPKIIIGGRRFFILIRHKICQLLIKLIKYLRELMPHGLASLAQLESAIDETDESGL